MGIDTATTLGNTPLHYAVIKQNTWAVRVLLTHRTDPYFKNMELNTPMSMALEIKTGERATPDAINIRQIFVDLKLFFETRGYKQGYDELYGSSGVNLGNVIWL
jgi:ankyrin repeat protein